MKELLSFINEINNLTKDYEKILFCRIDEPNFLLTKYVNYNCFSLLEPLVPMYENEILSLNETLNDYEFKLKDINLKMEEVEKVQNEIAEIDERINFYKNKPTENIFLKFKNIIKGLFDFRNYLLELAILRNDLVIKQNKLKEQNRDIDYPFLIKNMNKTKGEIQEKTNTFINIKKFQKEINYYFNNESKTKIDVLNLTSLILSITHIPFNYEKLYSIEYIEESKHLLINYILPDKTEIPAYKNKRNGEFVLLTETALNKRYDNIIYEIVLKTIYELMQSNLSEKIEILTFNGYVSTRDKTTGKSITPCVLSLQVKPSDLKDVELEYVDPMSWFKKVKGISATKLANLTPINPIISFNKEDKRFSESYSVQNKIDESINLGAMDWQDFEQLIRELFEKEFNANGGEVKITRASRDGGVDAVAFDPDPIKGGKIVIQAKRYTNVVGVSAVRDLYGTVMNEGANKGILITTSQYGSDSYEFAKGKPLTLLSGNELLGLLEKHGQKAYINLNEAKSMLGLKEK